MGKRILITGGAGFIGSHLSRELEQAGHFVRILDNFSAQVHGSRPERHDTLAEVQVGDVRNREHVKLALNGIDIVFHFAASVGVGQSMYEVRSYIDNNNLGTATLLQALITEKSPAIERLVVASSMSIYGEGLYVTAEGTVIDKARREVRDLERHDWEPKGPGGLPISPRPTPETKRPELASVYALSKFDQEQMCLMLGAAYKIPTVALRFFNVYGPGQALSNPYTGVMAIFASRILNGHSPVVYEDGLQKRDFVHVSDVARACHLAMQSSQAAGHVINIGSGIQYTILEIAERMARAMMRPTIRPELTGKCRIGDVRHCFADISLARKLLGFEPRITLSDGLRELTDWLSRQRAIDKTKEANAELLSRGLAI
ncbi:MAG: nucleoside-diphosphate-sugar epimerase [Bdellovibrionales bacterium RIFOXYC1_FULL_54_43]|nr:MAG: nucleoside-diphosphate-sugar epimerase [Bdellovibrionales bacterium RIFOXYC1_FULL_54_43]OFZ80648.1 MAG: nucleoside-diphosphate-sugar epimerase [Bdellovibrionales bacterium RIFOXYD1_FULL_55_31]